jgi:hypothetical protein
MRLFPAFLLVVWAMAQVRPGPYPQKLVTHYGLDAGEVPSALKGPGTLRVRASDGATWEGGATGLVRIHDRAKAALDRRQYFRGKRYLRDDRVEHIVPDNSGGVWVRTSPGFSHIEFRPMTLEEKAAYFEERIRARHDRYGMVADSRLSTPGDLTTSKPFTNDNDGLWTAMYAAAKCFEYQATKSPAALERARRAVNAVLFLEQVTGRPGYPARSYVRQGEARGNDGVWYWTPDKTIEWKSDTSSDEIVGHFFIFGIAYDLLPDPELKIRIAATARRIMDHIIGNRYYLIDVNGKPTTWGRWSPEYFDSPRGRPDAPLNALELLSFLLTAHHVTGDARYAAEYRKVAFEMRYAQWMERLIELRKVINYSDEELAMLPFYLAFRYENDLAMLTHYRRALDQWWINIQRENNPLWTFIYKSANSKAAVDLEGPVHTLYRIPMDLVNWPADNSHRTDIVWEPDLDRFKRRQTKYFIAPDERPVMKWNGNPFRADGGGNGGSEDDGAFFLLPYWMGRYHGYLRGK